MGHMEHTTWQADCRTVQEIGLQVIRLLDSWKVWMPVARGSSHPVLAMASSAAMNASNLNSGDVKTAVTAVDGGTAEGGEAECDGDDTKYASATVFLMGDDSL